MTQEAYPPPAPTYEIAMQTCPHNPANILLKHAEEYDLQAAVIGNGAVGYLYVAESLRKDYRSCYMLPYTWGAQTR